jgi:hypothetical protein
MWEAWGRVRSNRHTHPASTDACVRCKHTMRGSFIHLGAAFWRTQLLCNGHTGRTSSMQ